MSFVQLKHEDGNYMYVDASKVFLIRHAGDRRYSSDNQDRVSLLTTDGYEVTVIGTLDDVFREIYLARKKDT